MTQDEKWQRQYEHMMAFMNEKNKRPSKYIVEERGMLNWFKATKKRIAKGALPVDRQEKFRALLDVAAKFQRKNQYR